MMWNPQRTNKSGEKKRKEFLWNSGCRGPGVGRGGITWQQTTGTENSGLRHQVILSQDPLLALQDAVDSRLKLSFFQPSCV